MSEAAHLSHYDRERVCVPQICGCQRESCRYRFFLEGCNSGRHLFQICNHNLLLAAGPLGRVSISLVTVCPF